MHRSGLLLLSLAVLCSLPACGGAISTDAGQVPTADGGGASLPDGTATRCAALRLASPVQQVSDEPGMTNELTTAATGPEEGVLLGWMAGGFLRVRRVSYDAVPGPPSAPVLPQASSAYWLGDSLALGFGRAGAVAYDYARDGNPSCDLVPIDADGAASGSIASLGPGACSWPRATATGFDLIVQQPPGTAWLVEATAAGAMTSMKPLGLPHAPFGLLARASLDDGSFVLSWSQFDQSDCNCGPATFFVQHFSADGQALAPSHAIGSTSFLETSRVAMTVLGGGLLLAWATDARSISVVALDRDGNQTAKEVELVHPDNGFHGVGLDVAAIGPDAALVAWSQVGPVVTAQAVSATGSPLSPPVVVTETGGGGVRLVGGRSSALLAFDESSSNSRSAQVNAVALTCAP
jgi:hypothetical protein